MTKPTHAFISSEGGIQCVFPEGYDLNSLVELPDDFYTRGWYCYSDGEFIDDIESWRTAVILKANQARDARLFGGVDTGIGPIDTDTKSRQIILSIKMAADLDPDNFSVEYTLANNLTVTCSYQDIVDFILAIRDLDQKAHDDCKELKDRVTNSTTIIEGLL